MKTLYGKSVHLNGNENTGKFYRFFFYNFLDFKVLTEKVTLVLCISRSMLDLELLLILRLI